MIYIARSPDGRPAECYIGGGALPASTAESWRTLGLTWKQEHVAAWLDAPTPAYILSLFVPEGLDAHR